MISYNQIMEKVKLGIVHSLSNHKASPPYIAVWMLKYWLFTKDKPKTYEEWIKKAWSERKDWYYIGLYYSAIGTLVHEGIAKIYPDGSYEVNQKKAEEIVRKFEKEREEYINQIEAQNRERRYKQEHYFQILMNKYFPQFKPYLDKNTELLNFYSSKGRWLWVNRGNIDKRLIPGAIVLVTRGKRFEFGHFIDIKIPAKVIELKGNVVKVKYLCNNMIDEVPYWFIHDVLVDKKNKNILIKGGG